MHVPCMQLVVYMCVHVCACAMHAAGGLHVCTCAMHAAGGLHVCTCAMHAAGGLHVCTCVYVFSFPLRKIILITDTLNNNKNKIMLQQMVTSGNLEYVYKEDDCHKNDYVKVNFM